MLKQFMIFMEMLKFKIHNFASPFGRSEFHLLYCRCDADTLFMSPQFFWDSAALESLGSETRNNPKQPVIAMEIHVAVWLLVSSFGAPPNRIAPNICENNGIYHEVDSVNMSKHVQHVPKRLFSLRFGLQYVAVKP